LEAVGGLPEHPFDDPEIVVAETEVVIQGRKAMSGTIFSFRLMVTTNLKFV
jgi:hypothetical protein